MSQDLTPHWFLDRWCAELVVEQWRSLREAARLAGVSVDYAADAVRRVYGCGVAQARGKVADRRRWPA